MKACFIKRSFGMRLHSSSVFCGRRGYKHAMDEKLARDRSGEIFQDDLTENESMPSPARREDADEDLKLDPQVDSQDDDRAMAENTFGQNERDDENHSGS